MEYPDRYVVFDIDGTLSDCANRIQFMQTRQWDEFNLRCGEDAVNVKVAELVQKMSNFAQVVLFTERGERFREITNAWLENAALTHWVDGVLMRPEDNYMPALELKIFLLERALGDREDVLKKVWFIVEDSEAIAEGLRNYGLTVFQCSAGA